MFKKFCLALASTLLAWGLGLEISQAQTIKIGILSNPSAINLKNKAYASYQFDRALAHKVFPNDQIKFYPRAQAQSLLTDLKKQKLDLVMGLEAQSDLQNSPSYLNPGNVLFTRHDSKYKSLAKLTIKQKKVALLASGNQGPLLKQLGLKTKRYPSVAAIETALAQKQVAAAMVTDYQYQSYLSQKPTLIAAKDVNNRIETDQIWVRIVEPQITAQQLVFTSYHQLQLQKQIKTKLAQLKKQGQLTELSEKYYHQDWSYR
ncbi:substrate-binding periplasmic protein [Ligilactobacillus equi]